MAAGAGRGTAAGIVRLTRVPALDAELVQAEGVTRPTARHAHDSLCLGVVTAGERRMDLEGGPVVARAGQGLVLPPGLVHAVTPLGPTSHVLLCLAPDAALALVRRVLPQAGPLSQLPGPVLDDAAFADGFLALGKAVGHGGDAMALQALAVDCLGRLLEGIDVSVSEEPGPPPHPLPRPLPAPVARARDAIARDPATGMDMWALAELAGMSPWALSRAFRRHLGLPPHEFRNQERVRLAKGLLRQGQGIADTALACGFADQSHLCRVFSRLVGIAPGGYKSAHTRNPQGEGA